MVGVPTFISRFDLYNRRRTFPTTNQRNAPFNFRKLPIHFFLILYDLQIKKPIAITSPAFAFASDSIQK
ncbi:hypothetical protein LEP1GSC193_1505 [Leptospira alstonii serovar Pingchang str. 80-412]|uniref:Uncharacterized protein n=2 Tax=Leptospira alstonii TaxID=28452 RepID=M6CXE1_9LEPT|nr:hypothetical protein LEP1GSC194_2093 [Leptospira alstonii serovar Sichuan str. 79601]EQA79050.1 hypothetical protein LEP1GSC193_1505 [Leptospira alstonii serovar Pingchang str. 80-412]